MMESLLKKGKDPLRKRLMRKISKVFVMKNFFFFASNHKKIKVIERTTFNQFCQQINQINFYFSLKSSILSKSK